MWFLCIHTGHRDRRNKEIHCTNSKTVTGPFVGPRDPSLPATPRRIAVTSTEIAEQKSPKGGVLLTLFALEYFNKNSVKIT